MGALHTNWGWIAVSMAGAVGLWGIGAHLAKRPPGTAFSLGVWVAIIALLLQIALGLLAMNLEETNPGNQHVFYGVVIAFTLAFAYIYRAQFRKRPALYYGLLLLFLMGLGIRGILTFGGNF